MVKVTSQDGVFIRPSRLIVPVLSIPLDDTLETEQGKSDTVRKLYEDFVLGRLDPSQIGGNASYDADDATEVDPLNHFGITLEESTEIAERGRSAVSEVRKSNAKRKAEAEAKAKAEAEAVLRKKIQEEMNERGRGQSDKDE